MADLTDINSLIVELQNEIASVTDEDAKADIVRQLSDVLDNIRGIKKMVSVNDVLRETPLEILGLSRRTYLSLWRADVLNLYDLRCLLDRGVDALLAVRQFGEGKLDELASILKAKGLVVDDYDLVWETGISASELRQILAHE